MNYAEKVWDTFIRAYKGDLQAQAEILYVDAMLNGDNRLIKEEKKMLNFDKYRDEFEKRQGWAEREQTEKPAFQIWGEIAYTFGQGEKSARDLVEWLFSEYEPPLLRNGDGLKPGDCIMVRNDDDAFWEKRAFLFFYPECSSGRNFACAYDDGEIGDGDYFTWRQARLPEDGE